MPDASLSGAGGDVVSDEAIAALDVSAAWKEKFRLIVRAGGTALPRLDTLMLGERMRVVFNLFAFVLGPLYFLAKGLWRQALGLSAVVLIAMTVLGVVLHYAGLGQMAGWIDYGALAVYGLRANTAYYAKVVLGRRDWL